MFSSVFKKPLVPANVIHMEYGQRTAERTWLYRMSMMNRMVAFLSVVWIAMLLSFSVHAAEEYLEPDAAFKLTARMADARTIELHYRIAPGYYMYRERFAFKAEGAQLGKPVIPPGKIKFDETFQKEVETYREAVTISVPVEATGAFTLIATSQGCADQGLCYAPMDSRIKLSPVGAPPPVVEKDPSSPSIAASVPNPAALSAASVDSDMGRIEHSLKSGKLAIVIPLFFLLGIGLSFTPCVLPMVPILSFILLGEGTQIRRARSFALSATYSLGMALVYTALGIAAGLIGEGLSAALQSPWVLTVFSLLIVGFALSMFNVYQLQMPTSLQTRLARLSEKQSGGKLFGVFAMGAISALIVGPCVAAPLAGALVYISQTRNVVIGGSALFAMALGMSVPLLLVGISAGSLLPRAGAWMETVKRIFGVMLLALALWMISPVIPPVAQMAGWSLLALGCGAYFLWGTQSGWQSKAGGVILVALGLIQLTGAVTGGREVLAPLAHLTGQHARTVEFIRVNSLAELDILLAQAKGKPVMLDFYADWCVSCKEMEQFTFSDSRVQSGLQSLVLLQADVTANNAEDKALLKRFHLFGPPGIIFFDKQGQEIAGGRVIGYQNADKFLRSLESVARF